MAGGARRWALFALSIVVAGFLSQAQASACRPEHVPGVGRACRLPGGWLVLLGDGTAVLTHGGDPIGGFGTALAGTPALPSCVADPAIGYRGHAIYARALDAADRYAAIAPEIRRMIWSANGMLRAEAAEFGRALDYRMLCDNGDVTVTEVVLTVPIDRSNFNTVVTELRARGFASPLEKYWIWYDGRPPFTPAGIATIEQDDRPDAANYNGYGPSYAVTWGFAGEFGAYVMMHESAHNLGAVQLEAPHTSGGWHCNDGLDVMCYADGGSSSSYDPAVCGVEHFDCGHDDFFHLDPPPFSHLSESWNLAAPVNRFVAGCIYATELVAPGTGARAHAVPTACRGRPYSLAGSAPQPPVGHGPRASSLGGAGPLPDFDVCWFAGTAQVRCDTSLGAERGRVPPSATEARVTLAAGAGVYVLSAI